MSRSWAIFKYSISASSLVQRQTESERDWGGSKGMEKRGREGWEERRCRSGEKKQIRPCFLCFCVEHLSCCVIYKNSATELLRGWKHKHSTDTKHNSNSLTGFRGHAWWKRRLILMPPRLQILWETENKRIKLFYSSLSAAWLADLLWFQGQLSKKEH